MDKLELSRQEIDRIDREMAALFCRRMEAVRDIASYKRSHGLPILDSQREAEVLSQHLQAVSCELRDYYADYLQSVMDISKRFQAQTNRKESALQVELGARSYDVIAERGCLSRASELLNLSRRVLIVTDDGVPAQYAAAVAAQCKEPLVVSVPQGESSKSFTSLQQLLKHMISHHMTRNDCVVAVGGGMVGDLAGLAASLYMRGVDFYNIPTTLLAQVDSSVGGKTAVNFDGIKNIAGTFYQPKRVLLDSDVLVTLPRRQLAAGLAEALKMAITSDPELFIIFEQGDTFPRLDDIIRRSVAVKARVVAADERESGLRRVLNFGHTIGHAIESTHRSCCTVSASLWVCCPCAVKQYGSASCPSTKNCTFPFPVSWNVRPSKHTWNTIRNGQGRTFWLWKPRKSAIFPSDPFPLRNWQNVFPVLREERKRNEKHIWKQRFRDTVRGKPRLGRRRRSGRSGSRDPCGPGLYCPPADTAPPCGKHRYGPAGTGSLYHYQRRL